ncbi:methyl-accepting chemotaxis protein [Solirubrobacter soli]|uniref:methyl-accepting chemotaxis protein n=1 Tax=Solirubrobacter soli TaxID=363832 RepID=UPI00146DABA8|nr:methyl-accepting chemotaxis protein [Solirubrobacter soli]
MSIRTKLFAGFGAVLALLVISSLLAVSGMTKIDERSRTLAFTDAPSLGLLGEVAQATEQFRAAQLGFALSNTKALLDARAETLTNASDAIDRALKEYPRYISDPADKAQYDKFQATWKKYTDATAQVPDLARAGNLAEAASVANGAKDLMGDVRDEMANWRKLNQSITHADATAATDQFKSSRLFSFLLALAALVLGGGIAFWISRDLSRRAQQMRAAADGIAVGDVDQDVTVRGTDELAETGRAFGRMTEYLREMADAAERMAGGDFTVEVRPRGDRDLLGNGLQRLATDVRTMVADVSTGAGTVSAASEQMASTSNEAGRAVGEIASAVSDVAQGAERQVRMVESTREAIQEAARAAGVSADDARETAAAAEHTRGIARDGVAAAGRAAEAIRTLSESAASVDVGIQALSEKSDRIGGIVDTITGIAEQTNLLALNAAIEAARAGEQGKGFAVVAEEVRKLAEDSQSAAGQIASLIGEMQAETGEVVKSVQRSARETEESVESVALTREAFESIGQAVEDMHSRVEQIAFSVQQISDGTGRAEQDIAEVAAVAEESSASAEQVSASTQETSASTQEIAASAGDLAQTAEQLDALVRRFKVTVG